MARQPNQGYLGVNNKVDTHEVSMELNSNIIGLVFSWKII